MTRNHIDNWADFNVDAQLHRVLNEIAVQHRKSAIVTFARPTGYQPYQSMIPRPSYFSF